MVREGDIVQYSDALYVIKTIKNNKETFGDDRIKVDCTLECDRVRESVVNIKVEK